MLVSRRAELPLGDDDAGGYEKGAAMSGALAFQSHRSELNRRPLDYESSALPLSYCGDLSTNVGMPWHGLEP